MKKITSKQIRQIIREEVQRINEARGGTSDVKVEIVATGTAIPEMLGGGTSVDVKVISPSGAILKDGTKGFKNDLKGAAKHIEALFKDYPNSTYDVDTDSDKIKDALPKTKS